MRIENSIAISFSNVVKTYSNQNEPAVKGINLNISKGKVFGLLGPNGAGKTTSINMLCGLVKPTSGVVSVFDKNLSQNLKSLQKIIGVVPQDFALYPSLTAKENLLFFGGLYGVPNKELIQEAEQWMETFGLSDVLNSQVGTFSGGMKRRVNLIAGLLHNPELLILDEPTVGVDVQSRNIIIEALKYLNEKNNTTIIYTSHHLEEAQHFCDEIAIIDYGELVVTGKPEALVKEHQAKDLEEVFIKLTGKSIR